MEALEAADVAVNVKDILTERLGPVSSIPAISCRFLIFPGHVAHLNPALGSPIDGKGRLSDVTRSRVEV
jgi:hypothetical protein